MVYFLVSEVPCRIPSLHTECLVCQVSTLGSLVALGRLCPALTCRLFPCVTEVEARARGEKSPGCWGCSAGPAASPEDR
jgi:hypothetical protein